MNTDRLRQAAHDIRSPLSVLKILSATNTPTEVQRALIAQVVARIEQIAADILEEDMASARELNTQRHVQTLLDEKAVQFPNTKISFHCAGDIARSSVPLELFRVLSNLINNSIEAGAETIAIEAFSYEGRARWRVTDNGRGIPSEVLSQFQKDLYFSHGKEGGCGLGLRAAAGFAHSRQGDLSVLSHDQGTIVTLTISC